MLEATVAPDGEIVYSEDTIPLCPMGRSIDRGKWSNVWLSTKYQDPQLVRLSPSQEDEIYRICQDAHETVGIEVRNDLPVMDDSEAKRVRDSIRPTPAFNAFPAEEQLVDGDGVSESEVKPPDDKRRGASDHNLTHFPADPQCTVCKEAKKNLARFKRGTATKGYKKDPQRV